MSSKYSWPLPGEGVTAEELMIAEIRAGLGGVSTYSTPARRDAVIAEIVAALFNGSPMPGTLVNATLTTPVLGSQTVEGTTAVPITDSAAATTLYTATSSRLHNLTILGSVAVGSTNKSFVDVVVLDTRAATWTISVVTSTTIGGIGSRTYTQASSAFQCAIAGAGANQFNVSMTLVRIG